MVMFTDICGLISFLCGFCVYFFFFFSVYPWRRLTGPVYGVWAGRLVSVPTGGFGEPCVMCGVE